MDKWCRDVVRELLPLTAGLKMPCVLRPLILAALREAYSRGIEEGRLIPKNSSESKQEVANAD